MARLNPGLPRGVSNWKVSGFPTALVPAYSLLKQEQLQLAQASFRNMSYIYICIRTYIHTDRQTYIQAYASTHICRDTHAHMYTYIHIYIYTYNHTHIYIYTYTSPYNRLTVDNNSIYYVKPCLAHLICLLGILGAILSALPFHEENPSCAKSAATSAVTARQPLRRRQSFTAAFIDSLLVEAK